jgi:hypothetical protein
VFHIFTTIIFTISIIAFILVLNYY